MLSLSTTRFLLKTVFLYAAFPIETNLAWASLSPSLNARQAAPLPAGWNPLGCYTDSSSSRTLHVASYTSVGNMTIESCLAFCTPAGYKYAGVEYGRECYCDIAIQSSGSPANAADCNTQCTGNTAEFCGGRDRLSTFLHTPTVQVDSPPGWSSLGCYTDSSSSRALRNVSYTSVESMTIESCISFCTPAQYKYAGVENGRECYCDNTIYASGAPVNSNDCIIPCTGNATEICGATDRLNVFSRDIPATSGSTSIPSSTPTSDSTPTTSTASNSDWHLKHVVLPILLPLLGILLLAICLGMWLLRRKRLQLRQQRWALDPPHYPPDYRFETFGDGRG